MRLNTRTRNRVHHLLRISASLAILLTMCGAAPLPTRLPNAEFVVDSTLDGNDINPGDGICATSSGDCTLRAAIQETNALPGLDTIILPPGIYGLSVLHLDENLAPTSRMEIRDHLNIFGASAENTIVDGNSISSVIYIDDGSQIQFEALIVRHGYSGGLGAGILITGNSNVLLTDCVVSNNTVAGYNGTGGGIYNGSTLTLENSIVRDNQTGGSYGYGGGIYSEGRLFLNNSQVIYNQTNGFAAHGGGIYVATVDEGDTAIISNSTISFNSGRSDGGGLYHDYSGYESLQVTINDSLFQENYAYAFGGGVYSRGDMAITSTQFISNTAGIYGGAIRFFHDHEFRLSDCEVIGNTSGNSGGGISMDSNASLRMERCRVAHNYASGSGGGLHNRSGPSTITDSIFEFNQAGGPGGGIESTVSSSWFKLENVIIHSNIAGTNGGGIYVDRYQNITITNSTISQNQAAEDGGGIYYFSIDEDASMILENVTITDNYADSDADEEGDGGGVLVYYGMSVENDTFFMQNTLLADNYDLSSGTIHPNCSHLSDWPGSIRSLGYNLLGDSTGCNFIANIGDQIGTASNPIDPMLGPLQDNGGNTLTHALLPGSPAIDAIPVSACDITTDQRGVARPQSLACDIGAFELEPLTLVKSVSNPAPAPGETFTYTLQIRNNLTETLTGGLISDTLPAGLNFLGPITLEPPLSGTVGTAPPTLVTDLEIGVGEQVTVIFPVSVSYGLAGGTQITNTAWITGSQVITPVLASATLTITNLPPVGVDDTGAEYTTAENTPFSTGNVLENDLDPNGDLLSVASYDGSGLLGILSDNGDGSFEYDPNGQFEDLFPGEEAFDVFTYVVTDGILTDAATVTITVTGVNDNPLVDAGTDQTVDEGEIVQFQGSASDPGLRFPSAVVGFLWDFGDGTTATGTLTPTHAYLDNTSPATDGAYTVTLTVTDTHDGIASDWLLVSVENVSPTLSAFPDQEAIIGDPIALTGTISDPGSLDTQTVLITWADGFTETQQLAATERQFTVTHTYAQPGEYLVMVRVTDKDGGWDQRSLSVTVNAPAIYLPYIQR